MNKISKKIIDEFNIRKQAEELGVSFWQAPSFLFMVMGVIIAIAMGLVYFASRYYSSVEVLVVSEAAVVIIFFTVGNFIIGSVENFAKANKAKTEFISLASHQLKTPLAGISWSIEFFLTKRREGLSKEQLEILNEISQLNTMMNRLVNDLLDVARIEHEDLFLSREEINLVDLVKKSIEKNYFLAKAKKVSLLFPAKNKNEISKIMGDKRKIGVAVDNLVSNALQYTKSGGKAEIILVQNSDKLTFCVKDNGIGIPESQQNMVFEKFFRAENALKAEARGTGLGLYIVKNIIEKSGGKIWFKSIEDAGSMFCFSLPVVKKENLNFKC